MSLLFLLFLSMSFLTVFILTLFHLVTHCVSIFLTQTSSSLTIVVSNIARCTLNTVTHALCVSLLSGTARKLLILPPTSPSDSCVYVWVLCCGGGVVCTVEGYNLVVNKGWKNRWPEFRARCSPTAGKPVSCSWGLQSTGDLWQHPVVLRHSQTSPKHSLPKYTRP